MARLPHQRLSDSSLTGKDGIGQLHLFQTLANNPELLKLYRTVGGELRDRARLDDAMRGQIILTVAREMGAAYIWHQHVEQGLAAKNDISEANIRFIEVRAYDELDEPTSVLLSFVQQHLADDVSDERWNAASDHWSPAELIEAMFLASYYEMTAKWISTMEIRIESD